MKIKHQKGFTVIELMVSSALFVIIITVCTVVFINSLRSQRSLVSLMAVNDNMSLAIEQIAREVRTGNSFVTSGSELQFINAQGKAVTYRHNAELGILEKGEDTNFSPITGDNVNVKDFQVITSGTQASDGAPPRLTITITTAGKSRDLENIDITVQTTVSARAIDT